MFESIPSPAPAPHPPDRGDDEHDGALLLRRHDAPFLTEEVCQRLVLAVESVARRGDADDRLLPQRRRRVEKGGGSPAGRPPRGTPAADTPATSPRPGGRP